MGNQQTIAKDHNLHKDDSLRSFLKQLKIYNNQNGTQIKSLSNRGKLTIFQTKLQKNTLTHHNSQFYCLNTQNLYTHKSLIDSQSLKSYIKYYNKRIQLTNFHGKQIENFESCMINLLHFEIIDFATKQKIFPQDKSKKIDQSQQNSRLIKMPTCSFQNIFSSRTTMLSPSNISSAKKQLYTFSFLHQFIPNSLQKQIKYRIEKNQFFREKQIWSIIYCCCQAANKMVSNGLKQPVMSPNSIFINKECQIKVAQWEFINYYEAFQNEQLIESIFLQEGETFVSTDLELTINQTKNSQKFDILTRYYWPPQGIIYLQNTLNLGQIIQSNKQYELKNGQIFCLGMTILNMLTLRSYYRKSNYSEKQLQKLIQEAIQIRQNINQPISKELTGLLLRMLEWDPSQRSNYEQVIESIHSVFENNQDIFHQFSSRQITMRSSRAYQNQKFSENKIQPRKQSKSNFEQNNSLVIDKYKVQASQREEYKRQYNKYGFSIQIVNSVQVQMPNLSIENQDSKKNYKKKQLHGSGAIFQGLGDDYDPFIETLQENHDINQAKYSFYQMNKSQRNLNIVSSLEIDCQDHPDTIRFLISKTQQFQHPDLDVDFDPENSIQNSQRKSQKKWIQPSFDRPEQTSNSIQLNRFQIFDYVPLGWDKNILNSSIEKYSQVKSPEINNISFNQVSDTNPFNSQDKYSNTLKKNLKSNQQNLKFKNIQNSQQQNTFYSRNLQKIVKQINSPLSFKDIDEKENINQQKKQHSSIYLSHNFSNKQMLFTSPDILAVIQQFRKKDSQQTPSFQAVHMKTERIDLQYKKLNTKQLWLQQKPFDNCFINKSTNVYMENNDPFVKQQFQKGRFQGYKKNGLRNGFGTFYYKQGGKYCGFWYQNKMDGHGTLYYPDSRVAYEGQWKNDSLHGKGVLNNQKPNLIQGDYDFTSFDQCENQQCWIFYDGWFQNDQKSGFGQLLLSNGQKYVGQFKNDMVHGKGKFYCNKGNIFQGYWENNQLIGD